MKELIKIAKELLLDEKLFKLKGKSSARNYIRNKIDPYIRGMFRDDDWRHVKKVFEEIKELGVDLDWWVDNGGYSSDGMSKTYQFKIEYKNIYNNQMILRGQLICSFCGTIEDPRSVYDMTFQIF